ncbi:MAG: NUDIX hydrolase [Roseobacter sp.]|jgi:8-oxo-dGTP pyrophosphatase MutT (NUDIX family)|nr:NUDIX hydrolase [Roseobacter sp.]
MPAKSPRLAVRAIVKNAGRLLLVNAWPDGKSNLLCAPGGGVEPGSSLPANLAREVHEETGLRVVVGAPCLVNEFHDPASGFHQVEVFFHCALVGSPEIDPLWQDAERIVTEHHWVREEEFDALMVKPNGLKLAAFGPAGTFSYDPLERIVI